MIAIETTTGIRTGTRLRIATIDQAARTDSTLSPIAMAERAASTTDPGITKFSSERHATLHLISVETVNFCTERRRYWGGNVAMYSCAVALCGVASTL